MEQVIDDGRESEPGAGAFSSLIKNLRDERTVDDLIRQDLQCRAVDPVAKIDLVRERIQRLADLLFHIPFIELFASRR
jgi:hypothetical protein